MGERCTKVAIANNQVATREVLKANIIANAIKFSMTLSTINKFLVTTGTMMHKSIIAWNSNTRSYFFA
jgi:hypothetical protein